MAPGRAREWPTSNAIVSARANGGEKQKESSPIAVTHWTTLLIPALQTRRTEWHGVVACHCMKASTAGMLHNLWTPISIAYSGRQMDCTCWERLHLRFYVYTPYHNPRPRANRQS